MALWALPGVDPHIHELAPEALEMEGPLANAAIGHLALEMAHPAVGVLPECVVRVHALNFEQDFARSGFGIY